MVAHGKVFVITNNEYEYGLHFLLNVIVECCSVGKSLGIGFPPMDFDVLYASLVQKHFSSLDSFKKISLIGF